MRKNKPFKNCAHFCDCPSEMTLDGKKLMNAYDSKKLEFDNVPSDTGTICYHIVNDGDLFLFEDHLVVPEPMFNLFKKEYLKLKKEHPKLCIRYVTMLYFEDRKQEAKYRIKNFDHRKYLL